MKKIKFDKTCRRHFLIKALGITALALLMLVSITGAAPFAYIVNSAGPAGDGGSFSVIDTATNTITATVSGNLDGPGVAVNPAGTKVYVTNSGTYDDPGNTVSVIDTTKNKVTATVKVGNGPYGIAVSPNGKKVYVTNSGTYNDPGNTVSVIDTATNKVTATVKVGNGPYGVTVGPNGKKVYVTNSGTYNDPGNTVSVIDTATNKVTATVKVGNRPYGIAVSPNGKKAYVANSGTYDNPSYAVSVIDTATNKVTATVKVGLAPRGVAVNPAGTKVYVVNSGDPADGCFVYVIDTATNKVTATVSAGIFNDGGVEVTPDGKKVYVVNLGETDAGYGITVIDTATNKVTDFVENGFHPYAFGQFIGPSVTPPKKPVAAFSASPTSGKVPLKVQFTDKSTNSPTSWKWDFGDGTTSTTHNPLHTYIKAGTLTVTLTATNSAGSSTVTKKNYIKLTGSTTQKPVAAFSASPTSGTKPLVVTFTDKSTNNPTSWKWNFGDGTTSTTHNPIHTYIKAGSHTVTLTATNSAGSNKVTKTNYIKVTNPVKPVAAFSASPRSGTKPLKVQFTDKSTGSPTSWKWDFGDGTTSTTHNPLHTYIKKGKLTVKLTVKNAAGSNTKTISNYITVK